MSDRGSLDDVARPDGTGERGLGDTPIAIVGIGCAFPGAPSLDAYWRNVKQGTDAIGEVPAEHWDVDAYFDPDPARADMTYARRGGFLEPVPFDTLEFGIAPRNLEATDTTQLFALLAARDALRDAGYAVDARDRAGRPFDRSRTSVILGVTGALELVIPLGARLGHPQWRAALIDAGVGPALAEDVVARIAQSYAQWQENSFPGLLGNVAAGRVANRFDLGGTNCVVDAACASSLGALHLAILELQAGRANLALSGGIDTFSDIFMYLCFSKTPALSPTGDSRPFDRDGDGTILGEGAGVVVLKRLADAERDGDRIRAVIKGIGASSDGRGTAIYAPSASGQERALRAAYADAGVSPATIELFEAHGTGTRVGDATEVDALNAVYRAAGRHGTWCALGSVKSMIGHTKAAAGVAGLIKSALALEHKVLPPTLKVRAPLESLTPGGSPVYLNTHHRPWVGRAEHPRRAALSAFGFGGSNFHCVLEEHGAAKDECDWSGDVVLLAASAPGPERLHQELERLLAPLLRPHHTPREHWRHLRRVAAGARAGFDPHAATRAVLTVHREPEAGFDPAAALRARLDTVRRLLPRLAAAGFAHADGVHVGVGGPPGRLAVLFPGQGAQRPDMLKDLACLFPEFLDLARAADEAVGPVGGEGSGTRLSDVLFPVPVFDAPSRAAQAARLRDTALAQPALAVVELAAWRALQRFGIEGDGFAGHSFGELVALAAGGRLRDRELLELAALRGRLMAGDGSDRGGMLAVAQGAAELEGWLATSGLDLVIASLNGPRQTVLAGTTEAVEAARARLEAERIQVARLAVSGAFHSPLMCDAAAPFATALERVDLPAPPDAPVVYANASGLPYPSSPAAARALLARQLTSAVRFAELVHEMHRTGFRTFLEVGPGTALGSMTSALLADAGGSDLSPVVLSLDATAGRRAGEADLGAAIAALAALGHPVDLTAWDPRAGEGEPAPEGPAVVMIRGANPKPTGPRRPARSAAVAPEPAAASTADPATAPESPATPPPIATPAPTTASRHSPLAEEAIRTLARMHEQTAALHRQYLDGVAATHRALEGLLGHRPPVEAAPARADPLLATTSPGAETAAAPLRADPRAPTDPTPRAMSTPPGPGPARAAPGPPGDAGAPAPPGEDRAADCAGLVLEVVAAKTGYPLEMLRPEMALDTDLGIDSIKRVEILAALHDTLPDVPEPDPGMLAALVTLADVVRLMEGTAGRVPPGPVLATPAAERVLAIVADRTGYPLEALSLELRLEDDLGIDSIKRVEILAAVEEQLGGPTVADPAALAALRTLADVVTLLAGADPAPAAVPASPEAPTSPPPADPAATLLEVVSDKTGYPVEALGLAMHLESDLGIDSIKRVEILSALEDALGPLGLSDPEAMGQLDTLGAILERLRGGRPEATATAGRAPPGSRPEDRPEPPDAPPPPGPAPTAAVGLELLRPVLRGLDAGGRRRLDLAAGSEVWVLDDGDGLAADLARALAGHRVRSRIVDWSADPRSPAPALLGGLVLVTPGSPPADLLERAVAWVQSVSDRFSGPDASGDRVLVAVTRLGGDLGLGDGPAPPRPDSAALAGLVKSVAAEWPGVRCKVIDVPGARGGGELADTIVDELLHDGPLEVGLAGEGRVTVALQPLPAVRAPIVPASDLGPGTPVLVTGGARGITAELALALAARAGWIPILLGRTDIDAPEMDWLTGAEDDRAVMRGLRDRSAHAAPAELARAAGEIRAGREVRRTLERFAEAGLAVRYVRADVRDGNALRCAVAALRSELGPIRALVHGAGVVADCRIEDKVPAQMRAVYDTKVRGFAALLECLEDELRVVGVFSSSSARFGRRGQADYAAANEVLNKAARALRARRPECRVVSFNWGPWSGGMVTPALARVFEAEGIGLIDVRLGAELALAAMLSPAAPGGGAVELVVGAGRPDDEARATAAAPVPRVPAGAGARLDRACTHVVSVRALPFLRSHVLAGEAVLPLVISAEWLAQAALHHNPGLDFHGVDDLRVLSALKVGAHDEVRATALAALGGAADEILRIESALASERATHVRAKVVLASGLPTPPPGAPPDPAPAATLPGGWASAALYDGTVLFHGPDLHAIEALRSMSEDGISARVRTSPPPGAWLVRPLRSSWITDPLALDAAFQLMVVWCLQYRHARALPTYVERYRQYVQRFPAAGVIVECTVVGTSTHRVVANVAFRDPEGRLLASMDGCELVVDASLASAFARNVLIEDETSDPTPALPAARTGSDRGLGDD